jgi:hypothetical protein
MIQMTHHYADDGRLLTPPKELKALLKGAYSAFYSLLGHIRFFYVANEIWDGKTSIVFEASDEQFITLTIDDGAFHIHVAGEDFRIIDESTLDNIFEFFKKVASNTQRRPIEQLIADLNKYPSGIRCDLCLCYTDNNGKDFLGKKEFAVMDRNCYYGVEEGWGTGGYSPDVCDGTWCYTKTYACLKKSSFINCLDCGEYHTCVDCGVGHNPGECNLGITSEEVTKLIIPYCEIERLDYMKQNVI